MFTLSGVPVSSGPAVRLQEAVGPHPRDRSPWASSGPAGRLQEDVAPRPLWQELPGSSGPKLRLLEDGGHIHVDRSPGLLRTHGEASGGCGATSTLTGR